MAKSRQRTEWGRASLLAALVRNSYTLGKGRKKPFQPWEFDPFSEARPPVVDAPKIKVKVECLKGLCRAPRK